MKLNTKLVMMMLSLLIIAMLILFIMNQYSQKDLVQEIQESSTEVSKAIQLSVEDLTSETEVESTRLKEYLAQARNRGQFRGHHTQLPVKAFQPATLSETLCFQ